jgi:F-type H+-transporting ATPase subunit epsilon
MTEQNKIKLQILTPEKKFLEEEVDMVTAPAPNGEIGILSGHISMVADLEPGLVKIYQGNVVVQSIFVYGGFIEVNKEEVTILIIDAINKADVDYKKALTQMEEIQLKIMNVEDIEYRTILEQELIIYQRMIEISKET